MFIQALQFEYYKEPPAQLTDIFEQPLSKLKTTFQKDYVHLPYKFKRLRISTQHDEIENNIVINLNIQSPNFKVQQKFDYYDNNLTIHSQIISQKTTPKSSRSVSPLKKVYLGSSLVARRKLTGYVKPRKSPDPYELKKNKKLKSPRHEEGIQTLSYKTFYLLQKYGF